MNCTCTLYPVASLPVSNRNILQTQTFLVRTNILQYWRSVWSDRSRGRRRMKKCVGMFDFDRKSGCEADREKRDRFVIINSSEGRETLYCTLPSTLYLLSSQCHQCYQIKIIITTRLSFITFICIPWLYSVKHQLLRRKCCIAEIIAEDRNICGWHNKHT